MKNTNLAMNRDLGKVSEEWCDQRIATGIEELLWGKKFLLVF